MTVNDLIALLENVNTESLEITSQLHRFRVMNTKKPREINWLILEFNVAAEQVGLCALGPSMKKWC